jgi:hypothetical protein
MKGSLQNSWNGSRFPVTAEHYELRQRKMGFKKFFEQKSSLRCSQKVATKSCRPVYSSTRILVDPYTRRPVYLSTRILVYPYTRRPEYLSNCCQNRPVPAAGGQMSPPQALGSCQRPDL